MNQGDQMKAEIGMTTEGEPVLVITAMTGTEQSALKHWAPKLGLQGSDYSTEWTITAKLKVK